MRTNARSEHVWIEKGDKTLKLIKLLKQFILMTDECRFRVITSHKNYGMEIN